MPLPTLPQATVDTTFPTPGAWDYDVSCSTASQLNSALSNANVLNGTKNCRITLLAGNSFTGTFELLARSTGTGWVVIQSSNLVNMPEGKRVSPSDVGQMARLVSAGSGNPTMASRSGAHHYRLCGLEITQTTSLYFLIQLGYTSFSSGVQCSNLTDLPHHITVDRCYVHGVTATQCVHGIGMNAASMSVIDSYISQCQYDSPDSQALGCWNSPGPFKIENNYLSGSAEVVMFGGADSPITNLIPSDITFRRNYLYKPLTWKFGQPGYDGYGAIVKNCFELKTARRVLCEGNIMEKNWINGDQRGFAVVFTPRNQDGGNPWAMVQHVTFRLNIIHDSGSGINFLNTDGLYTSDILANVLVKDNIFYNIDDINLGDGYGYLLQFVGGVSAGPHTIAVDHNTMLHSTYGKGTGLCGDSTPLFNGITITNNILTHCAYGFYGTGTGEGTATFNYYFQNYSFTKNVIGPYSSAGTPGDYPAGNYFPATMATIAFTDMNGHNYLLTGASPYKNAGTDGKDIGADIAAVNAATVGTLTGIWGANPPAAPTNLRVV